MYLSGNRLSFVVESWFRLYNWPCNSMAISVESGGSLRNLRLVVVLNVHYFPLHPLFKKVFSVVIVTIQLSYSSI